MLKRLRAKFKRRDVRRDALLGLTTSGHLSDGERDRLFRQAKERRQHGK
jgi:hypothetical protein